jgi:hypothetical protein
MSDNIDIDTNVVVGDVQYSTLDDLFLKANFASEQEKQVGVIEAIRKYPREIFWTIIFALGLVMAGYDAQIISSLYALLYNIMQQQLIVSKIWSIRFQSEVRSAST